MKIMGEYTFPKLIEEVLRKEKMPLSAKEIWDYAEKSGLNKKLKINKGKTPWNTIARSLYVDIRDNEKSIYYQPTKRPAKFALKEFENRVSAEILSQEAQEEPQQNLTEEEIEKKFHERDLHPLLVAYANRDTHFGAYLKTIYHENSFKRSKGQNEWLHPDLVGVYFPFTDYSKSTLDLQKSMVSTSTKIFSFEMKIELNFGNLREYYFQAVSNSSWANEGYLVVLKLKDDDPKLIDEFRRLNNAFGIGLIKLNIENIDDSGILFPSRINPELDWETVNRMADDNPSFKEFLDDVKVQAGLCPFCKDFFTSLSCPAPKSLIS